MTNYTKTTDFAAKDSLPSGNAAKIVKGSEIDTEFNNIATASATKANANDAVLTGTTTAQTLDISGNVDVDGTLETDALSLNGVTVTSTAAELNYVDGVTSNIQTQLDTKAPLASPTFTGTVTVPGLTTTANVLFGDGDKAIFGAGSDLSIYSDGTQSFIQEDGPGALYIQGTHLNFNNAAGNASYITAVDGGAVTLFSAGSAKLATTSTGISVSGAVGAPSSEDFYRIKLRDTGGIANDVGIGQPDADSLAFNFTPTSGGHIAFFAGSSEKVRIDSSGNVGIGTSSPDALLRVNGTAKIGEGVASNTAKLMVNTASGVAAGIQLFQDGTESWIIQNPASTTALTFANSGIERMRLDSSGNLLVGTTSTAITDEGFKVLNNGVLYGVVNNSQTNALWNKESYTSGTSYFMDFRLDNSVKGSISSNGTSTAFNTSSDQRLKENIADADDAGSKVDAIQVRQFDWIADGSHQDYGMVAQELQSVAPEAVTGDAESDEMMGVDYSKLVPMLVKEIQSLRARVAQLENN